MGDRTPGYMDRERPGCNAIDKGTLCLQCTSTPGTTGAGGSNGAPFPAQHLYPAEPTPLVEPDSDFLRAALLLGARALISEANRPGIFRGLQVGETDSLDRQQGLHPISGDRPRPAQSMAEGTYRHTRPGGNAQKLGSDRISWTAKLQEAEAIAKKRGTEAVRIDLEAARRLNVQVRSPRQLLDDLADWRQQKELELAKAQGKNKIRKLKTSIAKIDDAAAYIRRYGEHHTVGPVPQKAVSRGAVTRIRIARNAGRVLMGLSIMLSVKQVADAAPDRRGAVLADEVAGLSMDLILPGAGPIGTYATQSARGELRTLSLLFPTVYTWLIDAYIGDALEQADPDGVRYVHRAMQSNQGMIELLHRMFGVPY
jgi:hypothetical protein